MSSAADISDPLALCGAVEKLDAEATPGPWFYVHGYGFKMVALWHGDGPPNADTEFVIQARQLLPQLATALRRLVDTETVARAAVEVVAECRVLLGLQRGEQLTEFCRRIAEPSKDPEWDEYDEQVILSRMASNLDDDLRADGHRDIANAIRAKLLTTALADSQAEVRRLVGEKDAAETEIADLKLTEIELREDALALRAEHEALRVDAMAYRSLDMADMRDSERLDWLEQQHSTRFGYFKKSGEWVNVGPIMLNIRFHVDAARAGEAK